ncbi:MAG: hypothetical protein FJZ58_07285 [Chlamydiae bacterium]|nr:hypothetical protein [Chlamydiota bacterium]
MENKKKEWLGLLGGTGTMTSFIPQVYKVWQNYPTPMSELSFEMFLIMTLGVFFWFVYGCSLRSPSLIIFNAITLLLSGSILLYKILYG